VFEPASVRDKLLVMLVAFIAGGIVQDTSDNSNDETELVNGEDVDFIKPSVTYVLHHFLLQRYHFVLCPLPY